MACSCRVSFHFLGRGNFAEGARISIIRSRLDSNTAHALSIYVCFVHFLKLDFRVHVISNDIICVFRIGDTDGCVIGKQRECICTALLGFANAAECATTRATLLTCTRLCHFLLSTQMIWILLLIALAVIVL